MTMHEFNAVLAERRQEAEREGASWLVVVCPMTEREVWREQHLGGGWHVDPLPPGAAVSVGEYH